MELASDIYPLSYYTSPDATRQAAIKAILAHDPKAIDILEILGLDT